MKRKLLAMLSVALMFQACQEDEVLENETPIQILKNTFKKMD